jgi:hypothetical protein
VSEKKTGLAGADALFQNQTVNQAVTETKPQKTTTKAKVVADPQQEKIVTSVRIFPTTLARIKEIVIEELKEGQRLTQGDVIDEAIKLLSQEKGLESK